MAYNDGGPAFPQCVSQGPSGELIASYQMQDGGGMTLRDWFAGQALTGLLSDMPAVKAASREAGKDGTAYLAEASYEVADAMLAARGAS